jgi:hypothetical protein
VTAELFRKQGDDSELLAVDSAVGRIGELLGTLQSAGPLELMSGSEPTHSAMYPGAFAATSSPVSCHET